MEIRIDGNFREFEKMTDDAKRQVPYITSQALNKTMTQAQTDVRAVMNKSFIIRKKSYMEKGIKIKPFSTKQTLSTTLSVSFPNGAQDVLSIHEAGGTKKAKGSNIAIPTSNILPDKTKTLTKSKRPRGIIGAFVKKSEAGRLEIAKLMGRGKKATLKVLYLLRSTVRIRPRFPFHDTAVNSIKKNVDKNFEAAWNEVMNAEGIK